MHCILSLVSRSFWQCTSWRVLLYRPRQLRLLRSPKITFSWPCPLPQPLVLMPCSLRVQLSSAFHICPSTSPFKPQSSATAEALYLPSLHKHFTLAGLSQAILQTKLGLTLTWPAGAGYGETVKFVGGVNKPKLVQCQDSAGCTHQQVWLCCCAIACSDPSLHRCCSWA